MYFVSEALYGAKLRYTQMEKIAYALVMASRKLRHYFLTYPIQVPSSYPLGELLRRKEASGRISKWGAELAPFTLTYSSRSAIRSQVLANFVA